MRGTSTREHGHSRAARKAVALVAMTATLGLVASGCSAGAPGGESTMDAFTVGTIGLGHLPVIYAEQQGYFEEEGLDAQIEYVVYAGGSAGVTALLTGDYDVLYSSNASASVALGEGLPVRLVAEANILAPGDQTVWVEPDSGYSSISDLAGKTASVNALNGIGELGYRAAMADAGVDPDSINLTEVAFPEAAGVLSSGNVDAAYMAQPFAAGAEAGGAKSILDFNDVPALTAMPVGSFFTSEDFETAHPDELKAFARALDRATSELRVDPSPIKGLIQEVAEVDEPTAEIIANVISYPDGTELDEVQRVFDLMAEYGLARGEIDAAEIYIGK